MNKKLWAISAIAVAAALLSAAQAAMAGQESEGPLDRQPQATSQVRPVYPYSLRRTRNKGEVLVDFVIDPQGNVVQAGVIRSSHPDFEAPAVEAVHQAREREPSGIRGGRGGDDRGMDFRAGDQVRQAVLGDSEEGAGV